MRVIVVEPWKKPYLKEIDGSLESMQAIVGGHIEAVYPFRHSVAVVCDEEGMLKGYQPNRMINGNLPIFGTFFLCGLGDEDFTDMPRHLIDRYIEKFTYENLFIIF